MKPHRRARSLRPVGPSKRSIPLPLDLVPFGWAECIGVEQHVASYDDPTSGKYVGFRTRDQFALVSPGPGPQCASFAWCALLIAIRSEAQAPRILVLP